MAEVYQLGQAVIILVGNPNRPAGTMMYVHSIGSNYLRLSYRLGGIVVLVEYMDLVRPATAKNLLVLT